MDAHSTTTPATVVLYNVTGNQFAYWQRCAYLTPYTAKKQLQLLPRHTT
jgi:hypothetical protein